MEDKNQSILIKSQNIELDIAKEFASVCTRNKLTYYMLGGTLLGAVRHKGFIPWDDDMDFGLPRNDYEKFLEIAPKELPVNIKLVTYKNTPDYHNYFSRLIDTNTKIIEDEYGEKVLNSSLFIDIFPIDGTPNFWLFRKIYCFRVLFHRALAYKDFVNNKRKRGFAEKSLIFLLQKMPIDKFTTQHKELDKIDKIMSKQKIKNSKYIGNIMGAYRTKEIMPAEFYGDGQMYPYEDTEFCGPAMYDEYLTWQYGNYMELPSEEDIERKTHYKIVELHGEKIESK